MNCIECGIKLGANTIHKKWETCKRCRSKIKHKCIDCDEICNKENGRCLSCGIKNAHKNKNYGLKNMIIEEIILDLAIPCIKLQFLMCGKKNLVKKKL